MIVKTRAEIRALVSRRARIVDHLNSHPTADLNTDIDESYRTMRDFVTERKWSTFLKTTGPLSLPLTAVTNDSYVGIPVPVDCRQVKKLETDLSSAGRFLPADEVGLGQLRAFNGGGSQLASATGPFSAPFRWVLLDQGMQATDAANTGSRVAGQIALVPIPTQGRYQLWYLPEFNATSADSGANGFYSYGNQAMEDYHVYHAASKCATSDNDSQGLLSGLLAFLGKAEAQLDSSAPSASGPKVWRRSRRYNG
jgi:hypothetical protein